MPCGCCVSCLHSTCIFFIIFLHLSWTRFSIRFVLYQQHLNPQYALLREPLIRSWRWRSFIAAMIASICWTPLSTLSFTLIRYRHAWKRSIGAHHSAQRSAICLSCSWKSSRSKLFFKFSQFASASTFFCRFYEETVRCRYWEVTRSWVERPQCAAFTNNHKDRFILRICDRNTVQHHHAHQQPLVKRTMVR